MGIFRGILNKVNRESRSLVQWLYSMTHWWLEKSYALRGVSRTPRPRDGRYAYNPVILTQVKMLCLSRMVGDLKLLAQQNFLT